MKALFLKAIEKLKSYNYRHINGRLLIWVYALLILGLNVISSATVNSETNYEGKQIFGIVVGTIVMLILMFFDYHFVLNFTGL